MQKRNILAIFVGLIIGLYTVLGMSLFTFINIKFNSVYYAQHMPHKEGTEPDIIMLMENKVGAYTPEIDGISYDDDGSYSITREKGTKTSVLDLTGDTLFFHSESDDMYLLNRNFSIKSALDKRYHKIDQLLTNCRRAVNPSRLSISLTIAVPVFMLPFANR